MEMLIVLALIGLMAAISFPSVSSGIDRLRLRSASDSLVGFLNGSLNWAERRQQSVEILIDPANNLMIARSAGPGFQRRLEFSDQVRIASIQPALAGGEAEPMRIVVYPGGTPPAIAVTLVNGRGVQQTVRIDPITGVSQAADSSSQ